MIGLKILIVEDDIGISKALVDCLENEGNETFTLHSGKNAVETIKQQSPDFVILDLMLPAKNGLAICEEVRTFSNVPILMLTARVDEIDRLKGLGVGADDYVCKPFFPKEIVARVRTITRRIKPSNSAVIPEIIYRSITLRPDGFVCEVAGQRVLITGVEFRLLEAMMLQPGIVFSRDKLKAAIYSRSQKTNTRSIDNHIKNLRRKLLAVSDEGDLIHTIYGIGYKVE